MSPFSWNQRSASRASGHHGHWVAGVRFSQPDPSGVPSFPDKPVGINEIQSSIFQGTIGLYMAYIGISHRDTLVGIHPTSR